jgi:hypothetical protein
METIANDCQALPTTANPSPAPVMRSLARVREWERNPRRGDYACLEELKASLVSVGLQDAIHVWERADGDYLLKGHRRFRAMSELSEADPVRWTECQQVVHHFDDEREAFKYLLEDHGHTVALHNEEKVQAMLTGVDMGLTVEDLARPMGVTVDRAQLWFDLGVMLPAQGREALATGVLSLNVAELLLGVEDAEERRAATQEVLRDPLSGEPMAPQRAKNWLDLKYVQPKKWERAWVGMRGKLMRKHPVDAGFHYVEFADRLSYLMGESGQPEGDFALAETYGKNADETWHERAMRLGVPVYVVSAPANVNLYVLVVNTAMVRDAERSVAGQKTAAEETAEVGDGLSEGQAEEEGATEHAEGSQSLDEMADWMGLQECQFRGDSCDFCQDPEPDARIWAEIMGGESSTGEASFYVCEHCLPGRYANEKTREADDVAWAEAAHADMTAHSPPPTVHVPDAWWRVMLGHVYEALLEERGKATQTNPPWMVLVEHLAQCPEILPRFEAWTGKRGVQGVLEWISADTEARGSMRMVLMLLLCLPHLSPTDPQAPLRAMAVALDLHAADLERMAGLLVVE